MRGVFYYALLSFGVGARFREDTGLTFVSENGRVLQKKQLNNSDRFLSGQDTGRPTDMASSGFFFLISTTLPWVPGTPEPLGDFDFQETPPRNFSDPAWQKSVTDEHIETIIKYGGAAVGKSPAMPANPDLNSKPQVVTELRLIVRGFGK